LPCLPPSDRVEFPSCLSLRSSSRPGRPFSTTRISCYLHYILDSPVVDHRWLHVLLPARPVFGTSPFVCLSLSFCLLIAHSAVRPRLQFLLLPTVRSAGLSRGRCSSSAGKTGSPGDQRIYVRHYMRARIPIEARELSRNLAQQQVLLAHSPLFHPHTPPLTPTPSPDWTPGLRWVLYLLCLNQPGKRIRGLTRWQPSRPLKPGGRGSRKRCPPLLPSWSAS